jgi:hypothetical protein
MQRIAAQLLENSLCSKTIALEMAKSVRIKTGIYILAWLIAALNRNTDLAIAAVAAQALFGEQVISRWLRLEWLISRIEKNYNDLYRLFQSSPNQNNFSAMALEFFGVYETAKAYSGITLSSKDFNRLRPSLTKDWERIKLTIGL